MKCEKCNHKQAKHFGFENDCQIPTCLCKGFRYQKEGETDA